MKESADYLFPEIMRRKSLEVESPVEGMTGFLFEGQDGSQIILWECENEVNVEPHSHEYDEYCLVIKGVCKETIEGKTIILKAGDEIIIPAGKLHWATMGPKYRAIDFFGGKRCNYKK